MEKHNDNPCTTVTHDLISQAMATSSDGGQTLDFSNKSISDIGETGAEELATVGVSATDEGSIILRIALGSNRLTTLPMNFALLSRLRYLNLRANSFTIFPEVLTIMPSLEILDISRNRLKHLPAQPGTLLELRVLSLSRNRLTRLPPYFAKAINLTVLQIDHNPLEWPPRYVIEPLENSVDDPDILMLHIENLKKWLLSHDSALSVPPNRMQGQVKQQEDISPFNSQSNDVSDTDVASDEGVRSSVIRLPARNGNLHERSFSVESDMSTYSFFSEESADSETHFNGDSYNHDSSPKLGNAPQHSDSSSPLFSPTSPPHASVTAITEFNPISIIAGDSNGSSNALHGRNTLHSNTRHLPSSRPGLTAKKSSPELRNIASNLSSERETPQKLAGLRSNIKSDLTRESKPRFPEKAEDHRDSAESFTRASTNKYSRTTRSLPGNNRNGSMHVFAESASSPLPNLPKPAPSMDIERNSYFRRLSTLPSTSMVMPEALVAMVESARGIFFGVSQIYQSLRNYTAFPIDDRLSGVLGKVLNPASTYMMHFINALDRFDSVSRRGIPPPSVSRGVLESCRDNMAVFGKVIGVLHLQLKVLAGADDARCLRGLVLMLYGSIGEIANSWKVMSSHLDAILPFLSERPRPLIATATKLQQIPARLSNTSSPLGESHPQLSPPVSRTPGGNGLDGTSRLTRRHAGSFSTRDLEIGKTLPSTNEELTQSQSMGGVALRSALKKTQVTSQNAPQSESHSSLFDFAPSKGQGSSLPGSDTSPPPFPFISSNQIVHSTPRPMHSSLDVPSDSSKMVDEDLLNTMEAATETARSVWKKMDEVLHTSQDANIDLQDSLVVAAEITAQLKVKIGIMRRGASDEDRRSFWEVAHFFVKVVVNVLTILKACSASYPFSPMLRTNIAKLTQSTQDFAILLQVSSFSPAPTPSPYSPAVSGLPPTPARSTTTGIARSKSAQATQAPSHANLRPSEFSGRNMPWSALPNQSFKISNSDM